jgi:transposase
MQVQAILNRVEKQKSFVYGAVQWTDSEKNSLIVTVKPHARSRPICSDCGRVLPQLNLELFADRVILCR